MVGGRIKDTLVEGALEGWKSSTKGLSPVPQIVMGNVNLSDMEPEEIFNYGV